MENEPKGPFEVEGAKGAYRIVWPNGASVSHFLSFESAHQAAFSFNRIWAMGRASRDGLRGALMEVAGGDCYNEGLWDKKPCGVCLTCAARKALAADEEAGTGGRHVVD